MQKFIAQNSDCAKSEEFPGFAELGNLAISSGPSSVQVLDQVYSKGPWGLPHIFITGKAGHGKDSIGDHLIACFGFEKLSFSDGIRIEVSKAYALSPEPVTKAWQDQREIKEISQNRLALAHCNDPAFVAVALTAFEREDCTLFAAGGGQVSTRVNSNTVQSAASQALLCQHRTGQGADVQTFSLTDRLRLARSPRRIQQVWGTEYRRMQNPHYWLNYAEQNANFSRPQVLTSVRYANELAFGARIHAVRIHVERPGSSRAHEHITEQVLPMDKDTIVILNTGALSDLNSKIDIVLAKLCVAGASNPPQRHVRASP